MAPQGERGEARKRVEPAEATKAMARARAAKEGRRGGSSSGKSWWAEGVRTSPSSTNDALPDKEMLSVLHDLVAPHVESFNFSIEDGLQYAVNDIMPLKITFEGGKWVRLWLEEVRVHKPTRPSTTGGVNSLLYPGECREMRTSYGARLTATVCIETSSGVSRVSKMIGNLPVMVRSSLCNLAGMSPRQLIRHKEDAVEMGGYFLCNGNERMVRMIQSPRRNHIMAVERSSFQKRGALYTSKAVTIRCVGADQSSSTVTLHFLRDGSTMVRVGIRKAEYFIPVMILVKALRGPMITDKEIYNSVLRGAHESGDSFTSDRVELALAQVAHLRLYSAQQCRAYLGSQFRMVLTGADDSMSNEECGLLLLRQHFFVHLNRFSLTQSVVERTASGEEVLQDEAILREKCDLVIEMLRKLYAFVSGEIGADNPDALSNHELLLPGHLYGSILKERLQMYLVGLRAAMRREFSMARTDERRVNVASGHVPTIRKLIDKQSDVGQKLFYFLATGNVTSESGLDLMQVAGFTIVAEKLNRYRYLSHFRSVHRGQFFTTMKTTAVRKLLPEAWGFLCPVHTPDGTPCGLLNHLSAMCSLVTHHPRNADSLQGYNETGVLASVGGSAATPQSSRRKKGTGRESLAPSLAPSMVRSGGAGGGLVSALAQLIKTLIEWGVAPAGARSSGILPSADMLPVMVDGRVVGHADPALLAKTIVPRLHRGKAAALRTDAASLKERDLHYFETAGALRRVQHDAHEFYSATMEVCFIPPGSKGSAFPGLFLFTGAGRMVRPVVHLETGMLELVGPMAQTWMEIAVRPEEVRMGVDRYCEIWPTSMLSVIASLTPFSDFNQSPRNMYQCQMGKQTMGTPAHNLRHRADNKMYRIQTPQAPLVQTATQRTFSMDEYPNGTNAVVAVISYTGYDMEDAMILNKSSYERGFAHASVYKTKTIDLTKEKANGGANAKRFCNVYPESSHKRGTLIAHTLGIDGLPSPGDHIRSGMALAAYINTETGQGKMEKYKDSEPAVVDQVRIVHVDSEPGIRKVVITLRINRNPVVGDKFSSRHGQKGVLSILWPQEDMPFTESGMTPDVIINPHAFPSRMTIGMLIESMAGKAGSLHGVYQDATPFTMQGDKEGATAVDYFGEQLSSAGYNYFGSEPLYSGLQGTEMRADIYIGVVYYQRLRHMVSDKSQVRSIGPIDPVTRQPVKGRKRMGGVRFGEMERDSLLAHGTSFIMRDRLLNCSDRHIAFVCCGSILGIHATPTGSGAEALQPGEGPDHELEDADEDEAPARGARSGFLKDATRLQCRLCGRHDRWHTITIPYVFRFLANELAAMGMRLAIL